VIVVTKVGSSDDAACRCTADLFLVLGEDDVLFEGVDETVREGVDETVREGVALCEGLADDPGEADALLEGSAVAAESGPTELAPSRPTLRASVVSRRVT
jgi:hypothetical protein